MPFTYKTISPAELQALASAMPLDVPLAFVLETSNPDPLKAQILSAAWSAASEPVTFPLQDDSDRASLARFLLGRPLILYDAARCCTFLRQAGISPKVLSDPKLMLFALDPAEALDLPSVSLKYAKVELPASGDEPIESGVFAQHNDSFFSQSEETLALAASAIKLLHDQLHGRLGWAESIYRQELSIAPICTSMQLRGIKVSLPVLMEKLFTLKDKVSKLVLQLTTLATKCLPKNFTPAISTINWMSNRDAAQVLIALGIPLDRKTLSGKLALGEAVLEPLKNAHPIAPLLSALRSTMKILGSSHTLKKFYNENTGAIHAEWLQTGVPTGRFRSRNPNLQQITEFLRPAFVSRPGYYFLNLDYDQLEYRILAACAGETALIEAFLRGEDVHSKTASLMLGIPLNDITAEQRALGKLLGYAQLYGSGAYGLAHKLSIPLQQAQALLNKYFAAVPKLVAFLGILKQTALSKGYVESFYGRRRPLPELFSMDRKTRAFGLRSAVNGFAQSTAADIAKQAMVRLIPVLDSFHAHMLVQLHDGLLLEVPDTVPPETILPALKAAAETTILGLPLTVSASWGRNWHDLTKLK